MVSDEARGGAAPEAEFEDGEEGSASAPPQNFGNRRFEAAERQRDQRAGRDIDAARHQPHLDDAKALVVDLARLEGELRHRDHRGDRRVLEQRDEIVADARQRVAERDRQDHPDRDAGPVRPIERAASVMPLGMTRIAARNDFGQVGAGIDGEHRGEGVDVGEADADAAAARRRRRARGPGSARCG